MGTKNKNTDYQKASLVNQLQTNYEFDDDKDRMANGKNYRVIYGKIPVLLSAPHAVRHKRKNKVKGADIKTGAIVEYLCSATGCYGIVRTYYDNDDPQQDFEGSGMEYKEEIIHILRQNDIGLFIDIHGANNTHDWSFCLGTNDGAHIAGAEKTVEQLKKELEKLGKVAVDAKGFKASKRGNVSLYAAQHTSIPCIQLEISCEFRNKSEKLEQLLEILEGMIQKSACKIKQY